jgi:hypothetical protein
MFSLPSSQDVQRDDDDADHELGQEGDGEGADHGVTSK